MDIMAIMNIIGFINTLADGLGSLTDGSGSLIGSLTGSL